MSNYTKMIVLPITKDCEQIGYFISLLTLQLIQMICFSLVGLYIKTKKKIKKYNDLIDRYTVKKRYKKKII